MLIRHADATRDAAACARIYAPFVLDSAVSFEERPPDAGAMSRRIDLATTAYAWLIAERDGDVVGFAYAARHRERAAYRWAVDVSVYVAGAHHRQGVGRTLYEALFGLLRRQGLTIACAGITVPNPESVALHEALGFEPVGVLRRIGYKHGAWRDVGWWQLELVAPAGGTPPEPGPPARLRA